MTRNLQILRDRITESSTIDVPKLICSRFAEGIGDIVSLSCSLAQLRFCPEITLNVLDFDDTIYSRDEQLQMWIFQDNRWEKGNEIIENYIGFDSMLEKFYRKNLAVQRLLAIIESQNQTHKAMILTAWKVNWQNMKCESIGIKWNQVPIEVVSWSSEKPRRLIDYIIKLGYIPWKIIVYEDRPEYFLQSGVWISQILWWIELVIDEVQLSQRPNRRQIKWIKQTIFVPQKI